MKRYAVGMGFRAALLGLVTTVAPATAGAQDPAPPPQPFKLTANAGLVSATGNSDITTLSGDQQLEYQPIGSRWTFTQRVGAVYGRTEGVTSANRIEAGLRAQRLITQRISAFVAAEYEKNRFAGIGRRFEEVLGLSYAVLEGPRTELALELGASLNQQRNLEGADDSFVAARTAGTLKHLLTETAYLQQKIEFLPNLEVGDDFRINSVSSVVAPLSRRFAVTLGYEIRYDHLPEPGFEGTDRVFTSGLQVTL